MKRPYTMDIVVKSVQIPREDSRVYGGDSSSLQFDVIPHYPHITALASPSQGYILSIMPFLHGEDEADSSKVPRPS